MQPCRHIKFEKSNERRKGGLGIKGITCTVPAHNLRPSFTDLRLVLSDGHLDVHRLVLMLRSQYFKAALANGATQLNLDDISIAMMDPILDYMYIWEIDISMYNVEMILHFARRFQVDGLEDRCCSFLSGSLKIENCLGILATAHTISHNALIDDASNFARKNFKTVAKYSNELFNMTPPILVSLMSSDELNVDDERIVFDAICRWISLRPTIRQKYIKDLLPTVRLGLLFPDHIDHVLNHEYTIIDDTIVNALNCNFQQSIEYPLSHYRLPHELLFAIGGWSGARPTNYVEMYDCRANRWVACEEMTETMGPSAYHDSVHMDGFIYVVGGFDGRNFFHRAKRFSLTEMTWQVIEPMRRTRCYVSLAELDGMLYACGGFDGQDRHRSCERYDPKTNKWTEIEPMQSTRSDAGAASLGGKLYIAGGFDGVHCLNTAEYYDPVIDQWTSITQMTSPRSGLGVITCQGKLFAVGGFDGHRRLDHAESFDEVTGRWLRTSLMTTGRSNFGLSRLEEGLLVVGGYNGATTIRWVEKYDPAKDIWRPLSQMALNRSALSVARVEGVQHAKRYLRANED